jgi:hypothetical protein
MKVLRHLLTLWVVVVLACAAWTQKFDSFGRDRAREILRNIAEDIKKHYYDPDFHGVDFDQRVRDADEKLRQSTSVTEAYKLIAEAIQGLNDPHTFFDPQHNTLKWTMGGKCRCWAITWHSRPRLCPGFYFSVPLRKSMAKPADLKHEYTRKYRKFV